MINIVMQKKHSPHTVTIESDVVDPHFCNVSIKKRSGDIVCNHYILKSDVAQWRDLYERDGFQITN